MTDASGVVETSYGPSAGSGQAHLGNPSTVTTTYTGLDPRTVSYTDRANGKLSTLTNRDDQGNLLSRYLDLQYKGTGDLLHVESDVPDGAMPTASPQSHRATEPTAQSRIQPPAEPSAQPPCLCVSAVQSSTAGNPTSYAGTTCTYDVANHLTAFGTNFTAGYRGDGLRAWQDSVAGKTYYLHDASTGLRTGGWRPVQELDEDGTPTKTYTFGANGLVAYGDALSQYDWQGNAAGQTGSGAVLSTTGAK